MPVVAICFLFLFLAPRVVAQDNLLRQAGLLDSQQKCGEAERVYQQALARGPASLPLLNNLGSHYQLCGDPEKAATYFERVLKLNPRHANANLQLARIAVDRHQGALALQYLSRINDSQPATRMLRAEALHWAGKPAQSLELLDGLRKETESNPRLTYLYGITCARVGAYDRAVESFNALLVQHPDDFDLLFDLGRAAARAKLYERAISALTVAAKLQPRSPEPLMELAGVYAAMGDYARAIYLLVQARQLAPDRPDISFALAHTAQSGEYYGDAALAYDEYLRLKPNDDEARRDRALVCGFTDTRQAEGLKDLAWYVKKHPDDPLGHFDIAQLTWRDKPQEAVDALVASLRLDPKLAAAQVDLAWLLTRLGRTAEAIPHLQKAIEINPRDSRALDLLGAADISLDKAADAEKVLRQAVAISPGDPEILMHLGRALMESGHEDEAKHFLEEFQRTRTVRARGPWREASMIESAGLPAAERTKRNIERLRKDAGIHPDDPELQLRLASLLLAEGSPEEAETEFRVLLERHAENRVWLEAGSFLLSFERYQLAREFLEKAAAANPAANLDLAIAIFFLEGPAKALTVLEQVPEPQRAGDYMLLKAKILDAAGQTAEAAKALQQGLPLSISRPRIAREAALLLVRDGRKEMALEFLTRASGNNPDLLLTRAMVLALMDRNVDAEKSLRQIESQWPEFDRAYLVHGLLLEKARPKEAKKDLQTALALGSQDPVARCTLARLESGPTTDTGCTCVHSIYDMLLSPCAQP